VFAKESSSILEFFSVVRSGLFLLLHLSFLVLLLAILAILGLGTRRQGPGILAISEMLANGGYSSLLQKYSACNSNLKAHRLLSPSTHPTKSTTVLL
jgi:hypothetical protein